MKTGIELIAQERAEQIEKHGRTVEDDLRFNRDYELQQAANALLMDVSNYRDFAQTAARVAHMPEKWDSEICTKMAAKSEKERLIIAGALLEAERERIALIITKIATEIDQMQAG